VRSLLRFCLLGSNCSSHGSHGCGSFRSFFRGLRLRLQDVSERCCMRALSIGDVPAIVARSA
jgi:hypothetical protein